jgi:short-subunit dehydrogenase
MARPGRARAADRSDGSGRTALITGASAGIGRELARVFAEHGFDLVPVARSGDALETLAAELRAEHGVEARPHALDLRPQWAPEGLRAALDGAGVRVDVLVNDAGILSYGPLRKMGMDEIFAMLELNVRSLTALTRVFVEPMIEAGWGRILNVSSIVAAQPWPSMAVYGATKTYIVSLTDALAMELDGTGVTATAFCPGFTATHMIEHIRWAPSLLQRMPSFAVMEPREVALAGYGACMRGDVIFFPGAWNRLWIAVLKCVPHGLVHRLGVWMNRRIG